MKILEKLTNIIEAVVFAAGNAVSISLIAEKLGIEESEVRTKIDELKSKYRDDNGIILLEFNGKIQFSSNPAFKEYVSAILNPIKEKELTKSVLECAAIIAYKQPITRTELEVIRGVSSDYAIRVLLEQKMIEACGRKDAIGKPILYATTDEFLKRFKLTSLHDLPDYDTLMEAIKQLNTTEEESYLYAKDTYQEPNEVEEMPDFLKDLSADDLLNIE